jgi:pilus assembly protein Flp/PilA
LLTLLWKKAGVRSEMTLSNNWDQLTASLKDGNSRTKMGVLKLNRRLKMKFFSQIMKNEDGATAIEYGLIAALIAVAAIVAMGALGENLTGTFGDVNCSINATDRQDAEDCNTANDARKDDGRAQAAADRAAGRG